MKKINLNGENSGAATAEKIYEVKYVGLNYGYAKHIHSIECKSKENADTLIAILKSEGYEIDTTFGGYVGE